MLPTEPEPASAPEAASESAPPARLDLTKASGPVLPTESAAASDAGSDPAPTLVPIDTVYVAAAAAEQARRETAVVIAGFWRRLLALIVDGFVLFAIGWGLGRLLGDIPLAHPLAALVLGSAVGLGYEALLDGPPGKGQTLGKQLLGIRVVGSDGRVPSWTATAWRTVFKDYYVFFNIVLTILGIALTDMSTWQHPNRWPGWVALLVVLTLGPGLADWYLFLIDGRQRRSLHDRVAGTWVVRARSLGRPVARPLWAGHYVVLAVLLAGIGMGGYRLVSLGLRVQQENGGSDPATLAADQQALRGLAEGHPEWPIREINLSAGLAGHARAAELGQGRPLPRPFTTVTIQVQTLTRAAPADHVAISRALARQYLARRPEMKGRTGNLQVIYGYSFSLGFYHQSWVSMLDYQPIGGWLTDAPPTSEEIFGKKVGNKGSAKEQV